MVPKSFGFWLKLKGFAPFGGGGRSARYPNNKASAL